jgi:hypothetical protein
LPFAERQRKKFNATKTNSIHQIYDILESPTAIASEDPVGDAEKYLNTDPDGDDLIDEMLIHTAIPNPNSKLVQHADIDDKVIALNWASDKELPVAAYPIVNPFDYLYESDKVAPIDPDPEPEEDNREYVEVDGEVQDVKRKKWRVDPERADKISPIQRTSEAIKPASRRLSYMPTGPSAADMKF